MNGTPSWSLSSLFSFVMILNHRLIYSDAKIANLIIVTYNRGFIYCEWTVIIYQLEFMKDFNVLVSPPPPPPPRQKSCHYFAVLKISEKELHFWKLQCSKYICAKFGECVLSSPKTTDFRPPLGRLIKKTGKAWNKKYESPLKAPFYHSIHLFEGHLSEWYEWE